MTQRLKINELHAHLLQDEAAEVQKAKISKLMGEAELLKRQNEFLKSQNCNLAHPKKSSATSNHNTFTKFNISAKGDCYILSTNRNKN